MKKFFNYNHVFYSLILVLIFFSGFDGSLLYQRTFIPNEKYTFFEYGHFIFSLFAGWFIGFLGIKHIVKKYQLNYVFRVSLLISSLIIWIQYKTNHHTTDRLFSQLIIDNVYCSILLGLLSYSLIRIINDKNEVSYIKKQIYYPVSMIFLGFIYSSTLNNLNLNSGFLLSSLIYFICYIYFFINGLDKLNYDIKLNIFAPLFFVFLIICSSVLIVKFQYLEHFSFIAEDVYPIYFYIVFLLIESILHKKNMIEIKKDNIKK